MIDQNLLSKLLYLFRMVLQQRRFKILYFSLLNLKIQPFSFRLQKNQFLQILRCFLFYLFFFNLLPGIVKLTSGHEGEINDHRKMVITAPSEDYVIVLSTLSVTLLDTICAPALQDPLYVCILTANACFYRYLRNRRSGYTLIDSPLPPFLISTYTF